MVRGKEGRDYGEEGRRGDGAGRLRGSLRDHGHGVGCGGGVVG